MQKTNGATVLFSCMFSCSQIPTFDGVSAIIKNAKQDNVDAEDKKFNQRSISQPHEQVAFIFRMEKRHQYRGTHSIRLDVWTLSVHSYCF